MRDADALVQVVRGFPDPSPAPRRSRPRTSPISRASWSWPTSAMIEKRLERLRKEKGKEQEGALLERCKAVLDAEQPLRTLGLTPPTSAPRWRASASRRAGRSWWSLNVRERRRARGRCRRPSPACLAGRARAGAGAVGARSRWRSPRWSPATARRSSPTSACQSAGARSLHPRRPTSCST